jgi:hypothetical protein
MSSTPRALSCAIQPKSGSVDFQYKVIDAICSLPPYQVHPIHYVTFWIAVEPIKDRGIERSNAWRRSLKMHRMKGKMRFVLFFTTSQVISPEKLRTKMLRLNLVQLVW